MGAAQTRQLVLRVPVGPAPRKVLEAAVCHFLHPLRITGIFFLTDIRKSDFLDYQAETGPEGGRLSRVSRSDGGFTSRRASQACGGRG